MVFKEPYRILFPSGIMALLWGALIWVPLLWNEEAYPVLAHRYLMLNGFAGSFIAGFLMTAVPKFSETWTASKTEVFFYLSITIMGIPAAYLDKPDFVFMFSSLQPFLLLMFMFPRISKRKANPPYSFIFIFVGLFLWLASGLLSVFIDNEAFKHLHYEGAIAAIILGVGSRLIPGILGHVEIVKTQRDLYERPVSLIKTIPLHFVCLISGFVLSYFLPDYSGPFLRAAVVSVIAFKYWRLWKLPKEKTALTWCVWISSWMILGSFLIKAFWQEGLIHISHSFFINGIVLLCLLIGTRVLQSHGPQNKKLEQKKILFVITIILIVAAFTRVSAFLMPEYYLTHLAYSSLMVTLAVLIWSIRYLRYAIVFPGKILT